MKGWERERELRRAAAAAKAAGGTIVGQPKILARMLVAIMEDGSGKVAMPDDLDTQFALIGRALTVAIIQALPRAPGPDPGPTVEQLEEAAKALGKLPEGEVRE